MIKRQLQAVVNRWLFREKVIIIYGARQVGKTTLAKTLLRQHGSDQNAYYNCEIPSVRRVLEQQEPGLLRREFGQYRLIVLDEAQYIPISQAVFLAYA